jgi:cytochrome P450
VTWAQQSYTRHQHSPQGYPRADEIYSGRAPTNILLGPWALHRDARFFEEPDAFRTQHWADVEIGHLQNQE